MKMAEFQTKAIFCFSFEQLILTQITCNPGLTLHHSNLNLALRYLAERALGTAK